MKTLVETRRLPEGNVLAQMQSVQSTVMDRMPWARVCASEDVVIDKGIFLSFMGLLGASLYSFSPQGRISGIEDMKMSQVSSLFEDGYAESTVFKTKGSYGFQPVTLGIVSMELLRIYLLRVRPAASCRSVSSPGDFLFIKWRKNDEAFDMGRSIACFFKIQAELNMTTNTLRAMVETYAETSFRQGRITAQERKAIENVNGHSSAVVEKHYLQQDRTSDVYHARGVFTRIPPTSPVATPSFLEAGNTSQSISGFMSLSCGFLITGNSEDYQPQTSGIEAIPFPHPLPIPQTQLPSTWRFQDNLKHTDWGTSHPTYGKVKPSRVPWSTEEIDYIEFWCSTQPADDVGRISSRCLEAIRQDPAAVPIFHKHHILSAQRLRNRYDA